MPNVVSKCKVVLYADDTALFYASKDVSEIQRTLNFELGRVHTWLSDNKLTLNVSKTKSMLLGTSKRLNQRSSKVLTVQIAGQMVEHVQAFKYLGVWIDSHLNWETHITKICSKISQRLGVLRRVRPYLTFDTTKMLYNAMVLPLFDYTAVV